MEQKPPDQSNKLHLEQFVNEIDIRVERLKVDFNRFFSGEIRIPPEKERQELEKLIRRFLAADDKSPRLRLLLQNLSSKFSLYNDLWQKRLNDYEMGRVIKPVKHSSYSDPPAMAEKSGSRNYKISLNQEETFENIYDVYRRLMAGINKKPAPAEKLINTLKHKMIVNNLVEARVNMAFKDGKLVFDLKNST